MIKTIFFDFGNVIGFFDHRRIIDRLAAHTDTPAAELESRLWSIEEVGHKYEMGRVSTEEFAAAAMRNAGLCCDAAEFLDAFCDIFWENPEVCELIPKLAGGYRLVLASNTNDSHFRKFRTTFAATLGHFNHLVVSHEADSRKPMPEFYAHCQRHAEAEPAECVFIDDLERNIEAARGHGWHGIVYSDTPTMLAELRRLGVEV